MAPGVNHKINLDTMNDVAVVTFNEPRLTETDVINSLGQQLYGLVEDAGYKKVLLNFSNVQFMSSTMIGKVMGLHRKLTPQGGEVVVCCLSPALRLPFRITQFDKLIPIYDDEFSALDSMAGG